MKYTTLRTTKKNLVTLTEVTRDGLIFGFDWKPGERADWANDFQACSSKLAELAAKRAVSLAYELGIEKHLPHDRRDLLGIVWLDIYAGSHQKSKTYMALSEENPEWLHLWAIKFYARRALNKWLVDSYGTRQRVSRKGGDAAITHTDLSAISGSTSWEADTVDHMDGERALSQLSDRDLNAVIRKLQDGGRLETRTKRRLQAVQDIGPAVRVLAERY